MHAAYTVEKAVSAKRLVEVGTLRVKKAAEKMEIEELIWRLTAAASKQELSVAKIRHAVDTMDVKMKLTE